MKTNYTVLTYNINNYEIVHPIKEKSDRARYIMVTDDPDLKDESGSWEIVYDDTLTGSAFDKVMQIRWNPWKYTDDYIVLRIDVKMMREAYFYNKRVHNAVRPQDL